MNQCFEHKKEIFLNSYNRVGAISPFPDITALDSARTTWNNGGSIMIVQMSITTCDFLFLELRLKVWFMI